MRDASRPVWVAELPSDKIIVAGRNTEHWKFGNPGLIYGYVPKRSKKEFRKRRDGSFFRSRARLVGVIQANEDGSPVWFFTSTFARHITDYNSAVVVWEKFRRILVREFPLVRYVVVPEIQKSGRWHFHAVLFGLPDVREMRERYGKRMNYLGKEVDAFLFKFTEMWTQANGDDVAEIVHRTNIQLARTVAGLARYLSKYLTKELGQHIPPDRRCYFTGGVGLKRPTITKIYKSEGLSEIVQPEGKLKYIKTFTSEHIGPIQIRRYLAD